MKAGARGHCSGFPSGNLQRLMERIYFSHITTETIILLTHMRIFQLLSSDVRETDVSSNDAFWHIRVIIPGGHFTATPAVNDISAMAPPLCGKSVGSTALRQQINRTHCMYHVLRVK
jgi:hypothetical protein